MIKNSICFTDMIAYPSSATTTVPGIGNIPGVLQSGLPLTQGRVEGSLFKSQVFSADQPDVLANVGLEYNYSMDLESLTNI